LLISNRPYIANSRHNIELFGEFTLALCLYHLFMFTDFEQNLVSRGLVGLSLVFLIVFHLLANLVVMVVFMLKDSFKNARKMYFEKKANKEVKTMIKERREEKRTDNMKKLFAKKRGKELLEARLYQVTHNVGMEPSVVEESKSLEEIKEESSEQQNDSNREEEEAKVKEVDPNKVVISDFSEDPSNPHKPYVTNSCLLLSSQNEVVVKDNRRQGRADDIFALCDEEKDTRGDVLKMKEDSVRDPVKPCLDTKLEDDDKEKNEVSIDSLLHELKDTPRKEAPRKEKTAAGEAISVTDMNQANIMINEELNLAGQ